MPRSKCGDLRAGPIPAALNLIRVCRSGLECNAGKCLELQWLELDFCSATKTMTVTRLAAPTSSILVTVDTFEHRTCLAKTTTISRMAVAGNAMIRECQAGNLMQHQQRAPGEKQKALQRQSPPLPEGTAHSLGCCSTTWRVRCWGGASDRRWPAELCHLRRLALCCSAWSC